MGMETVLVVLLVFVTGYVTGLRAEQQMEASRKHRAARLPPNAIERYEKHRALLRRRAEDEKRFSQ